MHDRHGKPIHMGDKVRTKDGAEFHVHGWDPAPHARHVAFAHDLEIIEKGAGNDGKPALGDGSIVWGNGPDLPTGPNT
jgi:hypothetical protein